MVSFDDSGLEIDSNNAQRHQHSQDQCFYRFPLSLYYPFSYFGLWTIGFSAAEAVGKPLIRQRLRYYGMKWKEKESVSSWVYACGHWQKVDGCGSGNKISQYGVPLKLKLTWSWGHTVLRAKSTSKGRVFAFCSKVSIKFQRWELPAPIVKLLDFN